ncbi:LAGLIDADG family homing endonuclease [Candidatus Woesearchaeota archaeon]|nr:LAGLIDADG family homing endonuclease [Candidatus Woesearchaeota archaeon]
MKNKKSPSEEFLSKRILFKNEEIRNQFFAKLKTRFSTWNNIGKSFNIYKSRLECFRNGNISMPYSTFLTFLNYLDKQDREFFLQNVILKDKNWGRVKGGISTYKKHKHIFEKGRMIRPKKFKHTNKYQFKFDMPLTPQLCELIGAFIGDGFTNKYGHIYMTQFAGHSTLDNEYFVKTLVLFIKMISPNSNPILTKKDNTLRLTIYSKEFHKLLTERFKFAAGKKAYTVTIPDEIINLKDSKLINLCVRGIYDTDGCIFYDKRAIYKNPYIRINLTSVSYALINQVYTILKNLNLNPRVNANYNKHVIQINGLQNCKKFIEVIGFSNKRHLDKIKHLGI